MMRAYKLEILIIDHDGVGDSFDEFQELKNLIENARYPNHCIYPTVMSVKEAEIGEWSDEHPLNQYGTMARAYQELDWK